MRTGYPNPTLLGTREEKSARTIHHELPQRLGLRGSAASLGDACGVGIGIPQTTDLDQRECRAPNTKEPGLEVR